MGYKKPRKGMCEAYRYKYTLIFRKKTISLHVRATAYKQRARQVSKFQLTTAPRRWSRLSPRDPPSTSSHRPVSRQPVRYAARTRISFSCQLWWIRLSNTGAPRRGARSDAMRHGLWFLIRVLLSAISARGGRGGGEERWSAARDEAADRRAREVGTPPPPALSFPRDFIPEASRDYARAWGSVTRLARVASSASLSLYRPSVTLLLSCLFPSLLLPSSLSPSLSHGRHRAFAGDRQRKKERER